MYSLHFNLSVVLGVGVGTKILNCFPLLPLTNAAWSCTTSEVLREGAVVGEVGSALNRDHSGKCVQSLALGNQNDMYYGKNGRG
jgi:hypothetical protein